MRKSSTWPSAICSRALSTGATDGRQVFAEIGVPEQSGIDEWRCPFWLRGLDTKPRYAVGVDGLQAMVLAVAGLRAGLEAYSASYTWHGDPDDHGIPVVVPTAFGREFSKRVEKFIEDEITALFPTP